MSPRELLERARRPAAQVLRGSGAVALTTAVCYRLHANEACTGFAYLTIVILNSLDSGFAAAALVSVFAVMCLDYFFIPPLLGFTVADATNTAALVAFGTASLITTHLASRVRREVRAAARERENLQRLYTLAQRLLALDPLAGDNRELAAAVCVSLGVRAVCLFDGETASSYSAGASQRGLEQRTRYAYIAGRDRDDEPAQLAVRCLRSGGRTRGAIGFEGIEQPSQMAGPAVAMVVAELDRRQAVVSATSSAAEARGEALRSAILDALAHEFKTPLAAILAAAGGLRASAPLPPPQEELAEMVESEAERLSGLTSRLLRLARLDREEVQPRLATVDLEALVSDAVERQSRDSPEHRIAVAVEGAPAEISADAGLLQLALAQLLDNACRYSPPGSPVEVRLEARAGRVAIVVWNRGEAIEPGERNRIFERMYRGRVGQRMSSGTGLGLYVARKIALAHGGNLELDPAREDGVAFRLTLPLAKGSIDGIESRPQSADRR